jgi:octaprenyl-diphosphate synthase
MQFEEYIDKVRGEIIESRIRSFKSPSLMPHANIFSEIMDYNFGKSGKLLRPLLAVLVSDSLGGNHEEAVHIASAIELVHAGSLTHDDLIDEDVFRHDQEAIWKKFGVKASVLFGDILFVTAATSARTLPTSHMAQGFVELMDVFGRASSGAMLETSRNPFDLDEYINVIKLKTASLYRASARLGCMTADATEETRHVMSEYAELVGTAFQIMDDLVDIERSVKENTPIGDVKEGKVTLPIILLRQKYPPLEKQCDIYSKGVEDMNSIAGLVTMLPEGIKRTENYIATVLNDAVSHLDLVPFKNGYKNLLKSYGRYTVDSMRKEVS